MNVAKTPKLDSMDARRMRDLIESAPFQLIQKRIQSELDRAVATCERSDIAIELQRAQGAAAALRTVLALPKLILKEVDRNGP